MEAEGIKPVRQDWGRYALPGESELYADALSFVAALQQHAQVEPFSEEDLQVMADMENGYSGRDAVLPEGDHLGQLVELGLLEEDQDQYRINFASPLLARLNPGNISELRPEERDSYDMDDPDIQAMLRDPDCGVVWWVTRPWDV